MIAAKALRVHEPPESDRPDAQLHLLVAPVVPFLALDVRSHHCLFQIDRQYEVPSGPEVLARNVPRPPPYSGLKRLSLDATSLRWDT